MKKLTLIRHAKSDWSVAALPDRERALNKRGRLAAVIMGQRLSKRAAFPDLLLSSPARRCRETAQLLMGAADGWLSITYVDQLYAASVETLAAVIRGCPEQHHVALLGHNPELSELARWLCAAAPVRLPTGAVLVLQLAIEHWADIHDGCGEILSYDYPKKKAESP